MRAREVESTPSLLGIEGTAARLYFSQFTEMIAESAKVDVSGFDTHGRAPPTARSVECGAVLLLLPADQGPHRDTQLCRAGSLLRSAP